VGIGKKLRCHTRYPIPEKKLDINACTRGVIIHEYEEGG
jgi:hypothetical protein